MDKRHGNRLHRRLQRWARWCISLTVIVSPWLIGGAPRWTHISLGVFVSAGVVIWLLSHIADPYSELRGSKMIAGLVLVFGYLLLQQLQLPQALVGLVSPRAAQMTSDSARVLSELHIPPGDAPHRTSPTSALSASPGATRYALILLMTYAGVFIVISDTVRRTSHLRQIATAVSISAFGLAIVSIAQALSGTREIYGLYEPRHAGATLFGPFTNRNHYATQVNLALGITLGLSMMVRARDVKVPIRSLRERVVRLFGSQEGGHRSILAFCSLMLAVSVMMSLSRGGILCMCIAGAIVIGVSSRLGLQGLSRPRVIFGLLAGVATFVVWLGWEPLMARVGTLGNVILDPFSDSRYHATRDTLKLFGAYPLFGCGFGCFQYAFPPFQGSDIQFGRFLHAHNDWVQVLAEGGIIGFGLVVSLVWLWGATICRGFWSTTDAGRRFLVGGLFGIAATAAHSFLDYSLHKPANGLLLAMVCGLMTAAVHFRPRATPAGHEEDNPS
ncbi:MAG: O-antigen ligase family protein [Verrucomicrobia bacterium]|nr:O-antigen ligase family protein [Verrucomicrobiota bacterium]MDA1087235.1 O-antigen ligase family protein [Verrucomicrobiota bacterium]